MHALKDRTFRAARDGEDAFHTEDVPALLAKKLREPCVKPAGVAVARFLNPHAADFFVVFVVGGLAQQVEIGRASCRERVFRAV